MNESDRRQRVISSTPRLSTDEIANRSFAKGSAVSPRPRCAPFLKRVAEEVGAGRVHEHELEAAIDTLEEQLRTPRPLSEQELLDALGEETARLLRSAREASDDIRKKAEERAARLVEEAAIAERTRAEADEVLASRTAEAEAKSPRWSPRPRRAPPMLEAARAEAEAIVEGARHQGREMLDEAKAARERVLGDLVRRRALLNAQIEALRGGRDRLLDAYRTVKRTFLEATEALAQVEARAAEERTASSHEPIDVAAEIAPEIETLDGERRPSSSTRRAVEGAEPGATGESESVERVQLVPVSATATHGVGRRRRRDRHGARRRRHAVRAAARRSRRRRTAAGAVAARRERTANPAAGAGASRRRGVARPPGQGDRSAASRRGEAGQAPGPGRPERAARLGAPAQGPPDRRAGAPRRRRGSRGLGQGAARRDRPRLRRGPGRGRRDGRGRRRRPRRRGRGGGHRAAARTAVGRDRLRRRRRHRRSRRTHRRALSRVEEPVARAVARRGARVRVDARASTTRFPTTPCCGGSRSRKVVAPTATTTRSSRR